MLTLELSNAETMLMPMVGSTLLQWSVDQSEMRNVLVSYLA
jgi:hypothetical protein